MATANSIDQRINCPPLDFDPRGDLPQGFLDFYLPLHRSFTARQQEFSSRRARALKESHLGLRPDHLQPSEAAGDWRIELPNWCRDQRNQMTGPADDPELVVKMLNSGAPGVMLDLEDSTANYWKNITFGIDNILSALRGELTYYDIKRQRTVAIQPMNSVVFTRPRGLHINQAGIVGQLTSASLFDVAMLAHQVDPAVLRHPLCFYIPKSESAEEALWWRDVFEAIAEAKRWPREYIKCMALVEAHPLAYQMEEFAFNLRDHLLGLNLGRWDYMASLIHFNLEDPNWVLPDRNTIPHDVPFFQRLRELMVEICHKHGLLAIGGMTALYPSREDPELNARALAVLKKDKKNESDCLMDGAWTGHPDQNQIAVDQFPSPNQLARRPESIDRRVDLRPLPTGIGKHTVAGTRAAVCTVIRYRNGVLQGKGASLLDGYMEDLATDRIYRLMIAQRIKHREAVKITDENGAAVTHTAEFISRLFDVELERLISELPTGASVETKKRFRQAREISEVMIRNQQFNPV